MMAVLRSRLSGGLVDAGLASLATFIVGLYVIRAWADTPDLIGVYALFFSAFGMATTLVTQLIFIPAEKEVLDLPSGLPRRLAGRVALRMLPVSTLCGALVVVVPSAMVLAGGRYSSLIVPLAATSLVAFAVSPIQDHVRRVLHLDRAGWRAAQVSTVQAVGALAGVVGVEAMTGDPAWAAFGGLAFANVTSLVFGLVVAHLTTRDITLPDEVSSTFFASISLKRLTRSGRWLGTAGVFSTAVNLLVSWMVTEVAGEASLGYAEAARTLAQPIVVVSMALRSVYGPDSMSAARTLDRPAARRVSNTFLAVLWPLTLAYTALVGWSWPGNVLVGVVPAAYVVSGLVAVSIVANGFNGASFPIRLELVGADRERSLFWTDVLSNVAMVVVSLGFAVASAGSLLLASMSRPAGMAALGLSRWFSYGLAARSHYPPPEVASSPVDVDVKHYPTPSSRLAVPVHDRKAALIGMAAYAPSTRRAEWFRDTSWSVVRLLGPRALPGRRGRWVPALPSATWTEVERTIERVLGPWQLGAVQTRSGGRRGFTMLALSEEAPAGMVRVEPINVGGVAAEVWALQEMERTTPANFIAPNVIDAGVIDEWAWSITSPVAMIRHRIPAHPDLVAITDEVAKLLGDLHRPAGTPEHWLPAHGDFTPWNLRDRRSGPPVLLDWESVCWAPPGADLALYRASAAAIGRPGAGRHFTVTPEIYAYWTNAVEGRITGAAEAGAEVDSLNTEILRILREAREAGSGDMTRSGDAV